MDSEAAPILENVQLFARMEGEEIAFGLAPAASRNGSDPLDAD